VSRPKAEAFSGPVLVSDHCNSVALAMQEAARRYILQQRDELVHIKEATDNDVRLLSQLEARVSESTDYCWYCRLTQAVALRTYALVISIVCFLPVSSPKLDV